jgi:hypothetical protein
MTRVCFGRAVLGLVLLSMGLMLPGAQECLAAQPSPQVDSETVPMVFKQYVDAEQFDAAAAFVARLDSLGQPSRMARVGMHLQLAYGRPTAAINDTLVLPWEDADTRRMRTEAARALQLLAAPPVVRDRPAYQFAFQAWSQIMQAMRYLHPDSVPAVEARAETDLARYGATLGPQDPQAWGQLWWEDDPVKTWAHTKVADRRSNHFFHPPFYRLWGVWRAPRLQAEAWFPPLGRPASDTIRPVPGKVNLICMTGEPTDEPGHPYSANMLAGYIRHWLQKYGAQDLEVTIVWPDTTHVIFRHPPQGQAGVRLQSSAAEAAWYLQGYEGLPVTVAVQAPHPQLGTRMDGRQEVVRRLQFNAFWAHDAESLVRIWQGEHRQGDPRVFQQEEDWALVLRPGERPGTCALIGRDGTLEHTGIQPDWLVNTHWAMRLLFEGGGVPPRLR